MCLGGGGGSAPDPYATANAQSGVNRDALITAAQLNQINQNGPFGSLSYTGAIGSPDRTQNVTLSPELQSLLAGQTNLSQGLTNLANTRLAGAPADDFSLSDATDVRRAAPVQYGTSFDQGPAVQSTFDQGPGAVGTFNLGGDLQKNIAGGPIATGFDAGGQVQRNVSLSGQPALNTDFSALSQQAQDAAYRRNSRYLDPQIAQQEGDLRTRLSAQGITQGSDAYNREMENFGRSRQQAYESARDQAIGQGFDLESQMFGQNLAARQQGVGEQFKLGDFSNSALAQQFGMNQAQAQFGNQAQQQGFSQNQARAMLNNDAVMNDYMRNQGLAQFGNQAAAQNYAQNLGAAEFGNQAAGQIYGQNMGSGQFRNDALARQFSGGLDLQGADQSLRSQGINENVLARNQNINEAMSYVNGAPISPQQPTFQPFAQSTAAQGSPDLMGLTASNYNAQQQARSGLLGSIFGAAGRIGSAMPWG